MNEIVSDLAFGPVAQTPAAGASASGWHAELDLRFARDGARTALVHNRHVGPLRVQRALYPEGADICHAVLLHPPSGIAGGDTLDIDVTLGEGTHALLTTPGATRWYKSAGRGARQSVRIHAADGARFEWLPQENLLFDEARAQIAFSLDLAPGAVAIGWDMLMLGRRASGEGWQGAGAHATLRSRIARAGKPLWIEQGSLGAGDRVLAAAPGMAGMPVAATLWACGPACDAALAERLAAQQPWREDLRAGVTLLPGGLLLARALGRRAEDLRIWAAAQWRMLRPAVLGVEARDPRIWST